MDAEGSLPANDAFMASSTIRVFSNSAHTESTLQECIPFRDVSFIKINLIHPSKNSLEKMSWELVMYINRLCINRIENK